MTFCDFNWNGILPESADFSGKNWVESPNKCFLQKNFGAPFYGWISSASRLQSHF